MYSNSQVFKIFISYLQRCLDNCREANDDLDLTKIQIGQGTTRCLKSLIKVLEDSTSVES
jgi:hypothetical protein